MNKIDFSKKGALVFLLLCVSGCYKSFRYEPEPEKTVRTKRTQQKLKVLDDLLQSYNDLVGSYPRTLRQLVDGPSDKNLKKRWKPVASTILVDDWGKPFVYSRREGESPPYELYSTGAAHS